MEEAGGQQHSCECLESCETIQLLRSYRIMHHMSRATYTHCTFRGCTTDEEPKYTYTTETRLARTSICRTANLPVGLRFDLEVIVQIWTFRMQSVHVSLLETPGEWPVLTFSYNVRQFRHITPKSADGNDVGQGLLFSYKYNRETPDYSLESTGRCLQEATFQQLQRRTHDSKFELLLCSQMRKFQLRLSERDSSFIWIKKALDSI